MLVDQRQICAALYALETTTTGHGHRGLESYKLDGPSSHFHPAGNDGDGRVSLASLDLPPTTNDESPGIGAPLALRARALADETAPLVAVSTSSKRCSCGTR